LTASTLIYAIKAIFSMPALSEQLILVGLILLIMLLVGKELTCISSDPRLQRLDRVLNLSLLPLLAAFLLVLVIKVGMVLQ
jgi:hypothetical protein